MANLFSDCNRREFVIDKAPRLGFGLFGTFFAADAFAYNDDYGLDFDDIPEVDMHKIRLDKAIRKGNVLFDQLDGRPLNEIDSLEFGYNYHFIYGLPLSGEAFMKMKNVGGNEYISTFELSTPGGMIGRIAAMFGIDSAEEALRGAEKCLVEAFSYKNGRFQTNVLLELDKGSTKPLHEIEKPRIKLRVNFDSDRGIIDLYEHERDNKSDSIDIGNRNGPMGEFFGFFGVDGHLSEQNPEVIKEMVCPLKSKKYLGVKVKEIYKKNRDALIYYLACQNAMLKFGGEFIGDGYKHSSDRLGFWDPKPGWDVGKKEGEFFRTIYGSVEFIRLQGDGSYQIPVHVFVPGIISESSMRNNAKSLIALEKRMKKYMEKYERFRGDELEPEELKRLEDECNRKWKWYENMRCGKILTAENVDVYLDRANMDNIDWDTDFIESMKKMCYVQI